MALSRARKRLEAERGGDEQRAGEHLPAPPLLAEPAEQRPGREPADEDGALAVDEAAHGRRREVRVLDRTERHDAVAEQRRVRAREPEQRGALRIALRRTGDEREEEPRRGEEADVGRPPDAQACPEPSRLPRYWSSAPNTAEGTSAIATSTRASVQRASTGHRFPACESPGAASPPHEPELPELIFLGQSVSLLGDQITVIALPLTAMIALARHPAQMGVLTTLYLLPNLLFSLHVGVGRPRGRRRDAMLVADGARVCSR